MLLICTKQQLQKETKFYFITTKPYHPINSNLTTTSNKRLLKPHNIVILFVTTTIHSQILNNPTTIEPHKLIHLSKNTPQLLSWFFIANLTHEATLNFLKIIKNKLLFEMSEEAPLTAIESLVNSVPFCNTAAGRILVFAGAGASFAYFVRPSTSFNPDGSAKNWIIFNPTDKDAAIFPWWAYVVVPGVLFGLMI
jgi:hypothetical protein